MKYFYVVLAIFAALGLTALIWNASTPKLALPETKDLLKTEEKTEPILDPYAAELFDAGFPASYAILLSQVHGQ